MGYSTAYSLEFEKENKESVITADELRDIQRYFEDKNVMGYAFDYDFDTYDGVKWYDHDEHMLGLSKLMPDILFTLSGEGEDSGDLWKKYYLRGQSQVEKVDIKIKPFDPKLFN